MKRFLVIAMTVGLATSAWAARTAPPQAPKVTLRSECEVTPACTVTIKDVAGIQASAEISRKIGDIALTTAPLAGQKRTVESSYVKLRLSAANLGAVKVVGPEQIRLVGRSCTVTSQQLQDEARNFLLGALPKDSRTYDVVADRAPREIVVASGGAVEIKPRLLNITLRAGTNTVALDVVVDGKVAASTTVSLQVKAVATVLVATDTIRQGDALTSQNTSWEERDVTRAPNALILTEGDKVPELVARRTLTSGSLINSADVNSPLSIHKGDSVGLTVKCGSVTLHTTAEAGQDGRVGDTIRVRSSVSNEDVRAKVVEPGLVEIAR